VDWDLSLETLPDLSEEEQKKETAQEWLHF